jgi:hypothetical protein
MGQPDKEYLDAFCTSYLGAVFEELLPNHPVWGNRSLTSKVSMEP